MMFKVKAYTAEWFRKNFEYNFSIGEVDAQYLKRVEGSVQHLGGKIISSSRNVLIFQISTFRLSKHKIVRAFPLGYIMKSNIKIHLDRAQQCEVVVENVSKKILYQLAFCLFVLFMSSVLIMNGRIIELGEMLAITVFIYVLASKIPSTMEYPRIKVFFQGLKN